MTEFRMSQEQLFVLRHIVDAREQLVARLSVKGRSFATPGNYFWNKSGVSEDDDTINPLIDAGYLRVLASDDPDHGILGITDTGMLAMDNVDKPTKGEAED